MPACLSLKLGTIIIAMAIKRMFMNPDSIVMFFCLFLLLNRNMAINGNTDIKMPKIKRGHSLPAYKLTG